MKELRLEELSVEQKIGQLLLARGFLGEEDKAFVLEMMRKKCVGAFQVPFTADYREIIKEVREAADYPILLCADMERGFPKGQEVPSAMALASINDPELAYEAARITAIQAKAEGFSVVWGPVVDISCADALCKVGRTFGDDPARVSELALAMIRGYQDEGLIATAKHFPGGSDMKDDPHIRDGVSDLDEQQLIEKDLLPYIDAIKSGDLAGIMTGHVKFPKIDPVWPTTMSEKVVSIIRRLGFDGIVMTDSMAMMGICRAYGETEHLGHTIAAGHDMVLPSYRISYKQSYNAMMDAYKKGIISDERLNEAVRRVLEAQHRAAKPASATELTQKQLDLVRGLNQRIICPVVQEGQTLALDSKSKKLFVLLCENEYSERPVDDEKEIRTEGIYGMKTVNWTASLIRESFPDAEIQIIQEFPWSEQIQRVCNAANHCDEVIFFTFNRGGSYFANEGLTKRVEYLIGTLMDRTAAIVHVGNPYAVKPFRDAKRLLIGFAAGSCEEYAIKALKGEYTPEGTLPVSFDD